MAGDLRRISTTMKVVTDVERIGDHAVNLAEWVEFVRSGRYHNENMF